MRHHCPNDRFGPAGVCLIEWKPGFMPQMIISQRKLIQLLQLFQIPPQQTGWTDFCHLISVFNLLTKPKLRVQNIRHIESSWNVEKPHCAYDLLSNLAIRCNWDSFPVSLSTNDFFYSMTTAIPWIEFISVNGLQQVFKFAHVRCDLFQHVSFTLANDRLYCHGLNFK